MHAPKIVQRLIDTQLRPIHASRRAPLAAAVNALLSGSALSLSRLARTMMGAGTMKAALKRMDRLIGNARIHSEAHGVAAAMLKTLSRWAQPLVIAIDWSAVAPGGEFAELRAVVSSLGMGRGLTIYQQVYPQSMQGTSKAEFALLECLQGWIEPGCEVVIVTDAGFRQPWFRRIEELGWQWIGRVRGQLEIACAQGRWSQAGIWMAKATGKASRTIQCALTRKHAWPCDVVLYRNRVVARTHYGRPGHRGTRRANAEARASAREPWLLAHSSGLRRYRPEQIVAMYARRMQIEENFRDTKSTWFGMGLEMSRSRSALRLHALLLIHTLAAFLLWHIGQLAEAEGLHRRFMATTRTAREISVVRLGLLLCALPQLPLSAQALRSLSQRIGIRS